MVRAMSVLLAQPLPQPKVGTVPSDGNDRWVLVV
jgi:hypothetical protein